MNSLNDTYQLNDGQKIPILGFGTWQMPNDQHTADMVQLAIETGYRHIDTATNYGNEEAVGRGIKASGIKRDDLYLTTKLMNPDHSYDLAKAAIDKSLQLLEVDYVDLYLIHWPVPIKYKETWQEANAEAWQAMEEAQEAGKIKSLGVSNFWKEHMDELLKTAKVKPAVNQIYLNPSDMQPEVVAMNKEYGILTEAYSPLGTGRIFEIEELQEIAEKYGKTVAQVVLRWSLQHGFLPLPKTETPARVKENADLFDFELSKADMDLIDGLEGRAGSARNPNEITH